jgi:hypothetical protein
VLVYAHTKTAACRLCDPRVGVHQASEGTPHENLQKYYACTKRMVCMNLSYPLPKLVCYKNSEHPPSSVARYPHAIGPNSRVRETPASVVLLFAWGRGYADSRETRADPMRGATLFFHVKSLMVILWLLGTSIL